MMEATQLTDWGHMPPSFDMLFGSHIHLGSITSFEDNADGTRNPSQVVIGNSGTQFVAMSEPPNDIFGLEVKQTEVMYQYGYLVATHVKSDKRGKSSKKLFKGNKSESSWLLEFKVSEKQLTSKHCLILTHCFHCRCQDELGRNLVSCDMNLNHVACTNLGFDPWFEEDLN